MKYIADKILISPDETPTMLRKKVAAKLGVRPSSLRVSIIRRRWWRGKSGGAIEVRVEAETTEFIHNTAYFASPSETSSLSEIKSKTRPVVVGFGLRGVIAAFALAKMGLRPVVLERGPSFSSSEAKSAEQVLHLGEGEGGRASVTGMLFAPDCLDPQLKALLAEEGILFEELDAYQHLPPAFIKSMVKRLHYRILELGGEIVFQAKYLGLRTFFGKTKGIYYEKESQRFFVKTQHVVIASGEYDNDFYLGFTIESSLRQFNQFIYGKPVVDSKLPAYFASSFFTPKGESRCFLMTGLPQPTLLDVGSYDQTMAQTYDFSGKGKNATSFLGLRMQQEEAQRLMKQAYIVGKPYSVPWSPIADFLARRTPLKIGSVKPANISRAQLVDMHRLYGPRNSATLEKALFQFGKAFPFLLQDDGLVGGMILLRGNSEQDFSSFENKGVYVASVAAESSLDFASVASSGFRSALSLTQSIAGKQ